MAGFLISKNEYEHIGEVQMVEGGRWIGRPYGKTYPEGQIFDTPAEAENYVRSQDLESQES